MFFLRRIVTSIFVSVIFLSGQLFAGKEQELKILYARYQADQSFAQERLDCWDDLERQLEKLDALEDKDVLVTKIGFYFICDKCDLCSARIAKNLIRFMSQNPYEVHVTEDFVLEQIASSFEFHYPSEYLDEDEHGCDDDAAFWDGQFENDFVSFRGNPCSPKNMGFLKHSAERKKYDKRKAGKQIK